MDYVVQYSISQGRVNSEDAVNDLLGTEVSTLSKCKIGKDLDGLFLGTNGRFDQILNGDQSLEFTIITDEGQVTNVRGQHFLHAVFNAIIWRSSHKLAAGCGNLLDDGLLGGSAQKGNLGNVVSLTNDSTKRT